MGVPKMSPQRPPRVKPIAVPSMATLDEREGVIRLLKGKTNGCLRSPLQHSERSGPLFSRDHLRDEIGSGEMVAGSSSLF